MGLLAIWFYGACCMLLISSAWRALKDAGQQIETSEMWVVFWDGAQRVEAKWDQVIRYGIPRDTIKSTLSGRFSVQTKAGDFAFSQHVHNSTLLIQIIRHWAPKSAGDAQNGDDQDTLGGEAGLWTGSCQGVGERVFHYKTRTNRAFLFFLICFAVIPLASPLLERSFGLPPPPLGSDSACVVTAMFVGSLCAAWRYHSARIVMSDRGLTERSAFGVRQLAWKDIRQYNAGEFIATVKSDRVTIRFWLTIAHADELKQEIERRAVNSETKGWAAGKPNG